MHLGDLYNVLGYSLTEKEVWKKLSTFIDDERQEEQNNNDSNNNDVAHLEEQYGADHHSAALATTLLGKRHSANNDQPSLKRRCVESVDQRSVVNQLTIETALLGERHSAECRGVNVFGAVPSNTSLRTIFRSLSHGIISNLHSMSPPPRHLADLRRIIGSGGALVRNSVMLKAVKDLYNMPVVINSKSDSGDSAVGAALAARRFL